MAIVKSKLLKQLSNNYPNFLKKDLEKERFKKSTIQILDNLTFNSKVIEYDRKQPEFKLNFSEYLKRNINSKKKKS